MMILESKMCVTMVSNDYQKCLKKGLKNISDILLQQREYRKNTTLVLKLFICIFLKLN